MTRTGRDGELGTLQATAEIQTNLISDIDIDTDMDMGVMPWPLYKDTTVRMHVHYLDQSQGKRDLT